MCSGLSSYCVVRACCQTKWLNIFVPFAIGTNITWLLTQIFRFRIFWLRFLFARSYQSSGRNTSQIKFTELLGDLHERSWTEFQDVQMNMGNCSKAGLRMTSDHCKSACRNLCDQSEKKNHHVGCPTETLDLSYIVAGGFFFVGFLVLLKQMVQKVGSGDPLGSV